MNLMQILDELERLISRGGGQVRYRNTNLDDIYKCNIAKSINEFNSWLGKHKTMCVCQDGNDLIFYCHVYTLIELRTR